MISTAGDVVVCSACGVQSPNSNRFCGMCGTPLPHRPLDTPGAQSTVNLTRGPLEIPQPAGRPREQHYQPADLPADSGPVSEDPLQVFAEDLDHPQLNRPEEMATTGETLAMPSEVLAFADALPPVEPSPSAEAPHFEWMDDVLEQVELELAKSSGG